MYKQVTKCASLQNNPHFTHYFFVITHMKRNFQSSTAFLMLLSLLIACNQEVDTSTTTYLPQDKVEQLKKLEQELMQSPMQIDTARAHALAKEYLQAANSYKGDSMSPLRLFKAAELFQAVPGRELEALQAFSMIELKYPESEYAAKALFVSGLIYDNQLRKPDLAREKWNLFLKKYPSHPYAEQILQLLAITDDDPDNDEILVQKWLEQAQQNQ